MTITQQQGSLVLLINTGQYSVSTIATEISSADISQAGPATVFCFKENPKKTHVTLVRLVPTTWGNTSLFGYNK